MAPSLPRPGDGSSSPRSWTSTSHAWSGRGPRSSLGDGAQLRCATPGLDLQGRSGQIPLESRNLSKLRQQRFRFIFVTFVVLTLPPKRSEYKRELIFQSARPPLGSFLPIMRHSVFLPKTTKNHDSKTSELEDWSYATDPDSGRQTSIWEEL